METKIVTLADGAAYALKKTSEGAYRWLCNTPGCDLYGVESTTEDSAHRRGAAHLAEHHATVVEQNDTDTLARSLREAYHFPRSILSWEDTPDETKDRWRSVASAAIGAAEPLTDTERSVLDGYRSVTRPSAALRAVRVAGVRIVSAEQHDQEHRTSTWDRKVVTAAVPVVEAWTDPGNHPEHHRSVKARLREDWPLLAARIDVLASTPGE